MPGLTFVTFPYRMPGRLLSRRPGKDLSRVHGNDSIIRSEACHLPNSEAGNRKRGSRSFGGAGGNLDPTSVERPENPVDSLNTLLVSHHHLTGRFTHLLGDYHQSPSS